MADFFDWDPCAPTLEPAVPDTNPSTALSPAEINRESHYRSLIKGISWRVLGTLDTIVLSWILSGRLTLGLKIGATEVVTKVLLFYFHERAWQRVPIGTIRRWFARARPSK